MNDLRINIYLATVDGPSAPEGPGWYIAATRAPSNEIPHEIIPRVRIPGNDMEKLGQVLDNFVKGKPQNWSEGLIRDDISLREAIRQANISAREILENRIEFLKSAQQQLEMLAQRAEEFGNGAES